MNFILVCFFLKILIKIILKTSLCIHYQHGSLAHRLDDNGVYSTHNFYRCFGTH